MTDEASPERRLWQQVILQAVRDAESISSKRISATGETGGYGARKAREWIVDCGRDFRLVCAMAGWDADFVSEAFRDGRLTLDRIADAGPETARRRRSKEAAE
jgi:hypothetical protein